MVGLMENGLSSGGKSGGSGLEGGAAAAIGGWINGLA